MSEGLFRVVTRHEGDGVVVALSGELDLAGERQLEAAIEAAHASGAPADGRPLRPELHRLLRAAGARAAAQPAATGGFRYRLIAGPPQVHRTFALCGLDRTLAFAA